MIPELGHFCLIVALLVALVQAFYGLVGAQRGVAAWIGAVRAAARTQALFAILAFAALAFSFYRNDFSVLYVAQNSYSGMPWYYRIAAVWGDHEGSMLLWITTLGLWTLAVTFFSRRLPDEMVARVLGVLGLVSFGFLAFTLFTSDPFVRILPAPSEGNGLNSLLQDPGMASHPPMLYMGYVGFSVAYAFAMAALLAGRLDSAWARWTRPWTTAAWAFLTLGIVLGSWWAYTVLGWGGWWFWDPVENASFMPWLAGAALIHSLAVTEKRGAFRSWTALLAIITFSLSLIGTFLVRSGVLSSVHAFAVAPRRGIYILTFLVVVIGASLLLYAWRAPRVGMGGRFAVVSREAMLLVNNVVFITATGAVLLGTLYPLIMQALNLGKITVGAPYFNAVFAPVIAPVLFLIGVGPIARWKQETVLTLAQRLKWAALVAVIAGLLFPFAMGRWKPLVALGLIAAAWSLASGWVNFRRRIALQGASGMGWRRFRVPRAYAGMLIAHAGVGIFVFGLTLVSAYSVEHDVKLAPGDTTMLAGYALRFEGTRPASGPDYTAQRGTIVVSRNGRAVTTLHPEKRVYIATGTPVTTAAISYGLRGDVYAALGDDVGNGAWTARLYHKPFVEWMWLGWVVMAIGGFIAISDKRYRIRVKAHVATALSPAPNPRPAPQPRAVGLHEGSAT